MDQDLQRYLNDHLAGSQSALVLIQDDERQPSLLEVIADSQTGLAAADDYGSERPIDHWTRRLKRPEFLRMSHVFRDQFSPFCTLAGLRQGPR